MKALMNEHGSLMIKRKGRFITQLCPFDLTDSGSPCGHWCPLFLEADDCENEFGFKQVVILSCGHGSPVHEIVNDKRKEAPDAK